MTDVTDSITNYRLNFCLYTGVMICASASEIIRNICANACWHTHVMSDYKNARLEAMPQ